jgi:UDP-glucose 4-epimerase
MIAAAEKATGKEISYEITGRRAGDPAMLVADNSKARKILGWQPKYGLQEIMETAWNWHKEQRF